MTESPELLPCPFCGGEAELRQNQMTGEMTMAHCRHCGASAFHIKWNWRAAAKVRAIREGDGEVKAFVADYLKSDGTTDYYVMIGADGREMSLHMHRIRGRAEYEAAEINHVISGSPKPEFDDFDVDGPAATGGEKE